MKSTNFQEYQRKLSSYEIKNREDQLAKQVLQSDLLQKQLQIENNSLRCQLQQAEAEILSLQALTKILPEYQQQKKDIQSLKNLIEKLQVNFRQQLAQRQKAIEQSTNQLGMLTKNSDLRTSNLSSLAQALQEKFQLEQQIQQLKNQKLLSNQNYEKKLVKKDQIIKNMNELHSQNQKNFKQLITKKNVTIKTLEEQSALISKVNESYLIQIRNLKQDLELQNTQNKRHNLEFQNLNSLIARLNQQINGQHAKQDQLVQLNHENTELKKQIQELKQRIHDNQMHLNSLTGQYQLLLNSYEISYQQNNTIKERQLYLKTEVTKLKDSLSYYTKAEEQPKSDEQSKDEEQLRENIIIKDNERPSNISIFNSKKSYQLQPKMNASKQIELKQQYQALLQQSRKQIFLNQLQLKKIASNLQTKINELKLKQNEIFQLNETIINNQNYSSYCQKSNSQLQQDKNNLLNRLAGKDEEIKNYQNTIHCLNQEIFKLKKTIEELEKENANILANSSLNCKQTAMIQIKSQRSRKQLDDFDSPDQQTQKFYECNDQKQLFQGELNQIRKQLEKQKQNSKQYLNELNALFKENSKLKEQMKKLEIGQLPQHLSASKEFQIKQLQDLIKGLQKMLIDKSNKLQQKSRYFSEASQQIKAQYEDKIKFLQDQNNKLSEALSDFQSRSKDKNNGEIISIASKEKGNFLTDDLENQFDFYLDNNKSQTKNKQKIQQPSLSNSRKVNENQLIQSKNMQKLGSLVDVSYQAMYDEVRIQNESLQAHLEEFSIKLAENKQKLLLTQTQNKKLVSKIQQLQFQCEQYDRKMGQLKKQLADSKEQLERFESLKQLLKIQKSESKEKASTIRDLEEKLSKLEKDYSELKEDYANLQFLNEQTNEKYKKTLESFETQMNHMNQQIILEKNKIQDKKRELKKIQHESISKVALFQDENLALKSKLKKMELQITKMEEVIKQLEEEQIQKVIISRTQFINYKQTQKRLQELEEQINSAIKEKDKLNSEKRSLQIYYEGKLNLINSNFFTEKEKLLKKITELEEFKTESTAKLDKFKEIFQKKRNEVIQMQDSLERVNKQNHQIKLQLSSALSAINTQLVKNNAFSEKIEPQESKIPYKRLLLQKNRNQNQRMVKSQYLVELQLAYKQVEKLNDVLMEKQKQIRFLLTQQSGDKNLNQSSIQPKDNYYKLRLIPENKAQRQQKIFKQFFNSNSPTFVPNEQSHYKSMKNCHPTFNQSKYQEPARELNFKNELQRAVHLQGVNGKKSSRMQFYQPTKEKYIGGFPVQFCTFSPEYHKI